MPGFAQDVACQGLVFVILREVEVVFFINVFYLRTPGELINSGGDFALYELHVVVLVLYVAEDFFNEVLQCHHSGCAPEFVDYYCDGAFLGQKTAHHFVCHQSLGGEYHRLEAFAPVASWSEQLAHVDVAEHIVNVLAVDDYLGASRLGEQLAKLCGRGSVDVHGHNLVTWGHAVAQVGGGEVESVVENLHFVLHLGFLLGLLVDGLFDVFVKVAQRDCP